MKISKKPPIIKLQPLRIPSSWIISYNSFTELDPKKIDEEDRSKWINFTEDLLQAKHLKYNILMDVGWYPEGNSSGSYGLELIKDNDWSNPLISYETRIKDEIVEKIELLLWQVGEGMVN